MRNFNVLRENVKRRKPSTATHSLFYLSPKTQTASASACVFQYSFPPAYLTALYATTVIPSSWSGWLGINFGHTWMKFVIHQEVSSELLNTTSVIGK